MIGIQNERVWFRLREIQELGGMNYGRAAQLNREIAEIRQNIAKREAKLREW